MVSTGVGEVVSFSLFLKGRLFSPMEARLSDMVLVVLRVGSVVLGVRSGVGGGIDGFLGLVVAVTKRV